MGIYYKLCLYNLLPRETSVYSTSYTEGMSKCLCLSLRQMDSLILIWLRSPSFPEEWPGLTGYMCTHQSTFLVLEEQRTKGKKDYLMLYCSTSQEQGNMCYIVTVPKGRTHSTMHLFCNKWTDPLSPEQHSSKHGLRADQWSIHLSTTLLSVLQDVLFISLFVHYLTHACCWQPVPCGFV